MSKMRVPRNGNGAAPTLAAAWVVVCALASLSCSPQTVPYPIRPRPGNSGGSVTPTMTPSANAGRAAGTGAGVAAANGGGAGNSSIMVFPVAGTGGQAPAPTTQAGASGGRVITNPAAGSAGTMTGNDQLAPFDAGADPDRNRAMPGGLCERLATIQCAAERHCCKAPGRTATQCQTSLQSACQEQLYLDIIANNSITGFDPTATLTTFTELESRSSQCDLGIPTWSLSSAGIRGILRGTRATGANCKPSTAELTEKSAQAAALASCMNSDVSACLPKSLLGEWKCSPKSSTGGGCATDENCSSDTYCRIPPQGTLGSCTQRVPLQGACSSGVECGSFFCSGGRCVEPDTQLVFCPAE